MKPACGVPRDPNVCREIGLLRSASDARLKELNEETARNRIAWYDREGHLLLGGETDPLMRAYRLILARLGIGEAEAPISARDEKRIVFRSRNFCPTLEACRVLGLDTRRVCRLRNEEATDRLIKCIDPGLAFGRNYGELRPSAAHCEEIITYG